jgi:replicative DNA helicase
MTFKSSEWNQAEPLTPDDVTRPLPHALGPEKSILSSILQDPREFIGVAIEEKLTPGHFYLPNHAVLFEFLIELFEANVEIELVDLVQRLIDCGKLDRIGGPSTLTDLYTYSPSPGHFRHHLQHVKDKFKAREIVRVSNTAIAAVYDSPDEIQDTLDEAERAILAIREAGESSKEVTIKQTVNEIIDDFRNLMDGKKAAMGMSTGFDDLDLKTLGLKAGQMFVVAARPGMGKSALMMNMVEHVCMNVGRGALVFSAEMAKKELIKRLVFSRAKFAISQVSRGTSPTKGDLQRIQRASLEIVQAESDKRLAIDDTPNISINALRAKARRKMREMPDLAFIAIDYLQLITCRNRQADGSREREIAQISAGIKALAKELGIPILILAQLNRGPESRTGKLKGVPRMSDLRESGAIEQDADLIGLLYRLAYYADNDDDRETLAGKAQLDLAKNRDGETGTVFLTFVADLMRFETGAPYQFEFQDAAEKKPKKADRWAGKGAKD